MARREKTEDEKRAQARSEAWSAFRKATPRHVTPTVNAHKEPADYSVVERRDPKTGESEWIIRGSGAGVASRTYPRVVTTGATTDEHGVQRPTFASAETVANTSAFAPRSAKNSKGGRVQTDPNATRETMLRDAARLETLAAKCSDSDRAAKLRSEARTLRDAAPAERPELPAQRGYGASWPTTLITRDTYRHHGHDVCTTCGEVCGAVRRPGPNGGLGPCSLRGKDRGKGDPSAPTMPYKAIKAMERADQAAQAKTDAELRRERVRAALEKAGKL